MNHQIRRVGLVLAALFVALFAQLNYLQVFHAHALATDPRNSRNAVRDFSNARGQIVSADGAVLAKSVKTNDAFGRLRQYPDGQLFAGITGFFSFTFGSSGVERSYNDELSGRASHISGVKDFLVNRTITGDVTLTVRKDLQTIARDSLGNRKGAIVALDPTNGAVLALWSYPSFDPNALAAHDQVAVHKAWDLFNLDPNHPMLPRVYRETYAPGSTFKVVTSAAALERKPELATKAYPVLKELKLPTTNRTLPNFGGETCGGTLPDLLRVSCNTGFGQMGLDLGAQNLHDEAIDFGFDSRPPLDLPAVEMSAFPPVSVFAHDLPALAKSAIGQQDVRATPLQMALVAAAVANDGVIMRPHVMSDVRDSEGNVVSHYDPTPWKKAISQDVANQLKGFMQNVVAKGTGTRAQIPGATVGGKTGTAQTLGNNSHAWFISFAEANGKSVVVAVIVESQPGVSESTGGVVAAPIAQKLMKAALGL